MKLLSWAMLIVGIVGCLVSFPLWAFSIIDDTIMIGITLVLSWMALWYAAALFIYEVKMNERREKETSRS